MERGIHMPIPSPNEELRQKEEQARAEAGLLRARTDLLKARQEYSAADKPVDVTVMTSTAEKARLDAQKGVLEAKKGLLDARQAADLSAGQAAIGTIAGSRLEGTVTVKQDAEKGEATLLAARAILLAAAEIGKALKTKINSKRIVLLSAAEASQAPNYRQFLLQKSLLMHIYRKAQQEAGRLEEQADLLTSVEAPVADASDAIPALTAAGVVIDAVAKLGSYFLSNYEIGSVVLTADVEQLVSAVADNLLRSDATAIIVIPARRPPQLTDFEDIIKQLAEETIKADTRAAVLSKKTRRVTGQSEHEKDQTKLARLQQGAALYDQAAQLLRNAISKAEEFITGLGAVDPKGVAFMTKVAQEKSACEELARPESLALVLDVRSAVGGYYTKKNLWTFLGGMPFFAMGGAVVTHSLTNKDGELLASGLIPIHSGYARVDHVRGLIAELPSRLSETRLTRMSGAGTVEHRRDR